MFTIKLSSYICYKVFINVSYVNYRIIRLIFFIKLYFEFLSLCRLYLVYFGLYLFESCIYIKKVIFIRNVY